MDPIMTIEAMICVPDIGTFRYVGKCASSDEGPIRDALDAATLDEAGRERPYYVNNGISMYGTSDTCRIRRTATFGTLDRLVQWSTMHIVSGSVSSECEQYLVMNNVTGTVMVCEAFSGYAGVYVMEWAFRDAWQDIPKSERPLLSNSDS